MIEQGSLVIDMSANNRLVWARHWRSQDQARGRSKEARALLPEGVRDLLQRFPPKS
jgi:hypothetical protein